MAVDADAFRRLMGCFATGVTIVTTAGDGRLRGMTANAVSSVSLDPLLVLVCVDHAATTYQLLRESGLFAINILTDKQEHLSRRFASRESDQGPLFDGLRYRFARTGAPILEESLAFLDCRVWATYPGGDHDIFVGQVEEAGFLAEAEPLLFYRGAYRRIGPE
jgi:flavin reductase (DIM6/NTAB) family NADH-FMN oxidoreductase RutF